MSWWVYLEDDKAAPECDFGKSVPDACSEPCYPAVEVACHAEGGTYVAGGTDCAELNVTYNYSRIFHVAFDGLGLREALHEQRAKDCLPLLQRAVHRLGVVPSEDYWEATEGNAGRALATLLAWATQHPEARFRVS